MKKTETIELDKDILEELKELTDQHGMPLDDLINDILKKHIKDLSDKE